VGVLTVLCDVALQAYVPSLVRTERLVNANSRLETSRSLAVVLGPSLGGLAVQVATAPVDILGDAVSFLFAAVVMRTIRDPETPRPPRDGRSLPGDVREGLTALLGQPVLRAITTATVVSNISAAVIFPILFLYLVDVLHLSPTLIGVAIAVNGLGGVLGAVSGGRASSRMSMPVILGLGLSMGAAATLLIAAASGPMPVALGVLLAGEALFGFAVPFFNVNQLSLRQALTPAHLQARVHATSRTLTWGAVPIGAYLGGQLGEHIGLRPTLVISGLGTLAAALIAYVGVTAAMRGRRSADASG
jgi:predicted MFS family arabinose efflux permease